MQLPFTIEQFFGVFRLYNITVWPAQVFLVLLAVLAVIFIAPRRLWSLVGSQAAFLLDVKPDFGLLVVGAAAVALFIWPSRGQKISLTSL
jgi:hypothetical protein